MENNENKQKKTFADFMSKASEISKKTAVKIQEGAETFSEQTKKSLYEQRMKKYNPLFKETFRSKQFRLPNVIEIVDDAVRRGIDVCEGAIGWTDKVNDVEILHLYDEWIKESKIQFLPVAKCDAVYCVDPFDKNKFINVTSAFERTTSEKLAELEHIAYCLGAKSCSIEITESSKFSNESTLKLKAGIKKEFSESEKENKKETSGSEERIDTDNSYSVYNDKSNSRGGKTLTYFEGNSTPIRPTLKWFSYDDNITGLIEMRCSGKNSVKSKVLKLSCSSSVTMSQKVALAVDKILKIKASSVATKPSMSASMSMEKKAIEEYSSTLIFEVEF